MWNSTHTCPLPEEGKPEYLKSLVDDAVAKGARIANDGGQITGTFFRPAVLADVKRGMLVYTTEQFGPVVPVVTYRDESEIAAFMRESAYGQQVSLFGLSLIHISEPTRPY